MMMGLWDWLVEMFGGVLFALTHVWAGSAGAAILTLSVVVRIALLPATLHSARRSRRMADAQRVIRPQLERLNERWKAEPTRLHAEVLRLYRRHGIRPVRDSGLVGGLVQLPFVAALYSVIREGLGTAGRFLWIRDLAKPDPLLALIASALTGLVAATAPGAGAGPMTRAGMALSMLVTFLVLTRMAAGIGLYWAASSAVGVAQGWILRREKPRVT
jgi:YidC/Oxa1 family membrane protein insertase